MKELVLGGDGLLGSTLVAALRTKGRDVTSLDIKSGNDLRSMASLSFDSWDRAWFLAWDTGGAKYIASADRQHDIFRNNCELAARVFDALAKTRKPFLFTTSQLAGQPTAYGLTKLLGESWTQQLGGKLARLWNAYGWEDPDVRSHVVTDLVLLGLRDGFVRMRTTGRERRRFLYKTDSVAGLIDLFDGSERYADIAGPAWVTIREVADKIASLLGVEVVAGDADGEEVMVDPVRPVPGWQPKVSLSEGISMVITEARMFLAHSGLSAGLR